MRRICGLVAVLLLLFIITPAYAEDKVPDEVIVIVASPVLTANSADTTTITVTVRNQSSTLPDLLVDFIVNDTQLGYMSPSSNTTDGSGQALTTFTVKDYEGTAGITARVHYSIGGTPYTKDFPAGAVQVLQLIPDTIEFNTTKEWLVANGSDSCLAVVKAYNGTSPVYPVPHILVEFSVQDPNMATRDPEMNTTNSSGIAISRITARYKSGNATLSAFISYIKEGIPISEEVQCIQKIDHDTPYELSSYNVPDIMSVGDMSPLIMTYKDRWGNPVDDRRFAENVTFLVSSPLGDALFLNASYPQNVTVIPVNLAGEAIAWLQASSSPAINTVRVNPDMGSIPDKYFFIQGLANRTPVNISQEFTPEGYLGQPPKLYADGVSRFDIVYFVTDEFGNGVMNTPIEITTSIPGEYSLVSTNSLGQAFLTYGPKTSIGNITITARAIGNSTSPPTCSKEVRFVSQEAESMQFSAVPDSLASRDVTGWEPAELLAKIVDENGNPVEGETVTFILGATGYDSTPLPPLVTDSPELENTTVVSNSSVTALSNTDGHAIAYFNPGGFSLEWSDPFYDDTASGWCVVYADWQNLTSGKSSNQSLNISWKNYPYLSIQTAVSPLTVKVNDTVNIQVKLVGDGWALRPKPIDAVLCTDRSGSMLEDGPIDRMVPVMNASRTFTGVMHVSMQQDHIGLVSFGTNRTAKISPEYRYLNGTYRVYNRDRGRWEDRTLIGNYYDWTNTYGVTNTSNSISGSSFKWVRNDGNWEMPTSPTYWTSNYWPYTINYANNSDHKKFVRNYYPGEVMPFEGVDNPGIRHYNDYAVNETHLSASTGDITEAINKMVPSGITPMRYALYSSINEIKANGRPKAIRAIILLSDGDYNCYGDPLARNSGRGHTDWLPTSYGDLDDDWHSFTDLNTSNQNMSVYAKNNNIRIYSIGYAASISTGGRNALRILAESTGGQYYNGSAANIEDIYTTIAGLLQEEAGVDTTMVLDYGTIQVNYVDIIPNETYRVFDYVPNTSIDSYWKNGTNVAGYPIVPPPDQSAEFNATRNLNFTVGTVRLNQTWEAVFTLRVLTDGNINVFGPDSKVNFNGTEGPSQLWIPKTYITAVANMTTTGVNTSYLNITVGDPIDSGTSIVNFPIYRNYTGNMTVKEDYYISTDNGMTWILMGYNILTKEQANQNSIYSIDRNYYPPGVEILFRVVGNALDAPGPVIAEVPRPAPPLSPPLKSYIILR